MLSMAHKHNWPPSPVPRTHRRSTTWARRPAAERHPGLLASTRADSRERPSQSSGFRFPPWPPLSLPLYRTPGQPRVSRVSCQVTVWGGRGGVSRLLSAPTSNTHVGTSTAAIGRCLGLIATWTTLFVAILDRGAKWYLCRRGQAGRSPLHACVLMASVTRSRA